MKTPLIALMLVALCGAPAAADKAAPTPTKKKADRSVGKRGPWAFELSRAQPVAGSVFHLETSTIVLGE